MPLFPREQMPVTTALTCTQSPRLQLCLGQLSTISYYTQNHLLTTGEDNCAAAKHTTTQSFEEKARIESDCIIKKGQSVCCFPFHFQTFRLFQSSYKVVFQGRILKWFFSHFSYLIKVPTWGILLYKD